MFRRGVTLIEALIVVALIGIMAAISFPAVTSGLDSIRLHSAADSVASFFASAMNRCDRRQQVIEIIADPHSNRLVMVSTEPGFIRTLELPQNVALAGDAERHVMLMPNGGFPRFAIDLVNIRGARRRISIDPITETPLVAAVTEPAP